MGAGEIAEVGASMDIQSIPTFVIQTSGCPVNSVLILNQAYGLNRARHVG